MSDILPRWSSWAHLAYDVCEARLGGADQHIRDVEYQELAFELSQIAYQNAHVILLPDTYVQFFYTSPVPDFKPSNVWAQVSKGYLGVMRDMPVLTDAYIQGGTTGYFLKSIALARVGKEAKDYIRVNSHEAGYLDKHITLQHLGI